MSDNATDPHGVSPDDPSWNPRSRPIVSCLNCRRKKQKCDRLLPCNSCIRSGRPSSCQYAPGQEPSPADGGEEPQNHKRRRPDDTEPQKSDPSITRISFDELQERVRLLESAFEVQQQHIRALIDATSVSGSGSPFSIELTGPLQSGRTKISAFSLFEPLHKRFPDLHSFANRLDDNDLPHDFMGMVADLRSLYRRLRQPTMYGRTFNLYDDIEDVLAHMERILPSQSDCRTLIDLYFQAFEGPLRVLHPIAKTQFRALLNGQLIPSQRMVCLPTLLAVVSIVSTLGTCHECDNPRLHGLDDGIGAYQLLRNYLDLLTEAQWTQLPNLQIAVLSLKSHKSSGLSAIQNWQWSGEIVRRAMAAGLHRTSPTRASLFEQEIRRRLWLTIIEMDLTFAVACNMPATCPAWDDEAPLSVNDSKLYPLMERLPPNHDLAEWTDGICQHFLARSFNDRRAAYALVSSDTVAPYSTILQHTRHLEQVIHDLPPVFRLTPTSDEDSDSPYRLLTKMELDFLLRRPLNACYAIHGAEMPPDDRFKEARIPWMQGCAFSICFQDLFDPQYPMLDLPLADGLWDFYHNAYRWDVDRFFLSSLLELQRLRLSDKDANDVASRAFQGHTLREPVKIMGWTIESITKSLEDTINPMTRRLGRHGSDFGEVVRWTAVMGALRVNPSCSRHHAMKNELQDLVAILRDQGNQSNLSSQQIRQNSSTRQSTTLNDLQWLKNILLDEGDEDAT